MLRGPGGGVAGVEYLGLPGLRVPQPQERAALGGLALAAQLHGVVADGGPEVGPPRGLAVVAVGARVGEYVDAAVPELHRQRVGVRVRGDAEEAVRAAVAPAPDLGGAPGAGPQQGDPGVGEPVRAPRRPARDVPRRAGQRAGQRAARVGRDRGHQSSRPSRASPSASSDGQRFGTGASRTSAQPSSPSPWRGGRSRWSSRAAALSVIAARRRQAAALSGCPAACASTAATSPSSATKHW